MTNQEYGTFYTTTNNRCEFYFGSVESVEEIFHKLTKNLGWGSMSIHKSLDELNKRVNEEKSHRWEDSSPTYYINADTNEEEMIIQ